MARDKNIASVLSFEKKLVPSDGFLFGTTWDKRLSSTTPLTIKEKSVRGTISNRQKPAIQNDPLKLNAEVEKPNLQTVDYCALSIEQDTLELSFSLKILSGVEQPSACNSPTYLEKYQSVVSQYIAEEKFTELGRRYAYNIANGRFLWKNRAGCEKIEIHVKAVNSGAAQSWIFDAKTIDTRNFESKNPDIDFLGQEIAKTLAGSNEFLMLEISVYAQIGLAQDVYPSQELLLDKGDNKKSKILYSSNGIAGMHSQKLGNALRTIDTWYPDYEDLGIGPIPIETYGAVTNMGIAFRTPKAKADFYTLLDRFTRGEVLDKNDRHYVMAVLVRGGVFSEKEK
jgi:CRISPR-associated protein Csy3